MRNPGGFASLINPNESPFNLGDKWEKTRGTLVETDTFTCFHCNHVKHVRPRERPEDLGGLCKCCMKLICARCVGIGNCVPFEKKLEAAEARDRALRSYGI